jgi:hypothetical protein
MFDKASVRVTAGMLLWGSGMVLIAVLHYVRVIETLGGLNDQGKLAIMLTYMLGGVFFGVIFGGIICAPSRPLWPNVIALITTGIGTYLSPSALRTEWPYPANSALNGLIAIGIFSLIGAAIGFVLRHKRVAFPFSLPQDSAAVALEEIQRREASKPDR